MSSINKRVLFLFGAGASFGAGGILPEPPPLGGQLFRLLANQYRGTWGQLPPDIALQMERNFEAGMGLVQERFATAIPGLMREMALYFSQFRPYKRSSLYCRLVRDLVDTLPALAFSTLNYECVLEHSLLEAGMKIDYFGSGDDNGVPVWKLHGSCNMFSHQLQASEGIFYNTGITFEGGIEASLDRNDIAARCLAGSALAPAMSLYMVGKPLAISPSVIRSVQGIWAEAAKNAKAVICVGVRAHPPDTHIWEPLASAPAPIHFVGDEVSFERWCSSVGRRGVFLGSRFSNSYSSIIQIARSYAVE